MICDAADSVAFLPGSDASWKLIRLYTSPAAQ